MAKKIITIGPKGLRERVEGSGPVDSYSFDNLQVNSPYTVGELPEDRFDTIQEAIDQWDVDGQPRYPIYIRPKGSSSISNFSDYYYSENLIIPKLTQEFAPSLIGTVEPPSQSFIFSYRPAFINGNITIENEGGDKTPVFYTSNLVLFCTSDTAIVYKHTEELSGLLLFAVNSSFWSKHIFSTDGDATLQISTRDSYLRATSGLLETSSGSLTISECVNTSLIGGADLISFNNPGKRVSINAENSFFDGRISISGDSDSSFNIKNCRLEAELGANDSHINFVGEELKMENCNIKTEGADSNNTVITSDADIFWTGIVENENFANSLLVDAPNAIDLNYNLSIGVIGAEELSTGVNVTPVSVAATVT